MTLDTKFRSLLAGLSDYAPKGGDDRDLFIESRAMSVIASVSHLVNIISENYEQDVADDLIKRLFNAARTGDEGKFSRKIRTIREGRTKKGSVTK